MSSADDRPEKTPTVVQGAQPRFNSSEVRPLPAASSYGYFSGQKERPLREYIAILAHYRYLILICVLIGTVVGYYQNKKVGFEFSGEALVSIGSYIPATDGPTAAALQMESSRQDYVTNLLQLIMSYRIAQYVFINDEKVWNYYSPDNSRPGIEKGQSDDQSTLAHSDSDLLDETVAASLPVHLLEAYLQKISFTQVDGGSLVRIYARAADPEMAAYLANTHSNAFIELVRDQRRQTAGINVKYLENRASELAKSTAAAQEAMLQFAKEHNLTVNNGIGNSDGNMGSIVSGLSDVTAERALLDQQVRDLRPSTNLGSMKLGNDAMPLVQKMTELEGQYASLYAINSTHPELKIIRSQIDNLKKIIRFSADQQRKESEMKRRAASAKENLLRNEFKRLNEKEVGQSQNRLQYAVLEREYAVLKESLEQVQKRLEDALIQSENDQKTAQVVDAAVAPMYPSTAPKNSNVLTTALVGLFVGIGLAFLLDSQDGTIRTLSDLRQTLDQPVLGIIPVFSKKLLGHRARAKSASTEGMRLNPSGEDRIELGEGQDFSHALDTLYEHIELHDAGSKPVANSEFHPIVVVSSPFSREAEAFRNLRTTMMFSSGDKQPKKVLFTSAQKGVGKTTVAVNVAASIAQTGIKVVLVDADLRMPTTQEHFGLGRYHTGLSNHIEGNATLEEITIESGIPNLSLILAGTPTHSPSELLSSAPMFQLLSQLENQYGLIVIDTPPVGEIADALLLSHSADGVIMVVRSGVTLKNSAKLAATKLHQVKASILGIVFNGVNQLNSFREGSDYYYSKYGSYGYYSYNHPPEKSPKAPAQEFENSDPML